MAKQQEHLSSVHNAVRILREFSDDRPELGITELSERLGLPKPTIFRLLHTLKDLQLVAQNKFSKKYRLGLGAFFIGSAAYRRMEIRSTAFPHLFDLMKRVRRIVRLGVYDEGAVVYVCKLPEDKETTQFSGIGNRSSCHCTAAGKVLLAFQEDCEINRVLASPLQARTSKSIVDGEALRKQLEQIRRLGYALTHEEATPGVCSVAVPVHREEGEVVAAISVTGSKSEFLSTNIRIYLDEMKMYSRLIGQQLSDIL